MDLKNSKFKLPPSVVTLHDVTKLILELDKLENFLVQIKLGKLARETELPKMSTALENSLRINNTNLLKEDERANFKLGLQTIRTKAPSIHISFSGDPSNEFIEAIITWMRVNIHPFVILQIGLQPGIGAGFTLRTKSKFFDFSLKQRLAQHTDELIQELGKGLA